VSEFLETLHKEWPEVSGAPWSFLIAIAAVGGIIWLFVNFIYRKEIAGKDSTIQAHKAQLESQVSSLKEQIAALEQQLKLASKQTELADRAKNDVENELQTLKKEIDALKVKAESDSLAKVEAQIQNVESAIVKLATANNAVSYTVSRPSYSSQIIEHMRRNKQ
jgi:chromosome segregation ATPase